jgi:F0F1-type ATP synthase assembly protein I
VISGSNNRTVEEVRRDIESEREQLAGAADTLREEISEATNIGAKLRANLPAVAVGALGVGFLLAGGVGATARLIFRGGR